MSDAADRGFTVTEMAAMDQPIDVLRESTAAFVGRALRGPINEPVLVHDFGEFRRRFGDVWSRSSLGPAVQQFFEHGGKNLYVVRVANNARGAMICLPASGTALVLRALEPGSTESIRAAVDYDGIDADKEELFNLTLQRIDARTGLVADQELFQYLSIAESSNNFVVDALLNSTLVRAQGPLPTHRPEPTRSSSNSFNTAYVGHTQDGTDGHELSDYDLVGSRKLELGLFALEQVDRFDLLYLPPPGKHRDLGPTAILAAEGYCRKRGAMLVVDPQIDWETADAAIAGIRNLGYASPNLLSYFPRLLQRSDSTSPARAVGGALAGLLCKLDRKHGAWADLDQRGLGFSRNFLPALEIADEQMLALIRAGMNVVAKGPAGSARVHGSVTLGRGSMPDRRFTSLPVRRVCLQVISAIDRATRWAVFEEKDVRLAQRIRAQVSAYLGQLADMGAFASDQFIVECDVGIRKRSAAEHGFAIFVAFQPRGCDAAVSFTLHQTVGGSQVMSTAFAPG